MLLKCCEFFTSQLPLVYVNLVLCHANPTLGGGTILRQQAILGFFVYGIFFFCSFSQAEESYLTTAIQQEQKKEFDDFLWQGQEAFTISEKFMESFAQLMKSAQIVQSDKKNSLDIKVWQREFNRILKFYHSSREPQNKTQKSVRPEQISYVHLIKNLSSHPPLLDIHFDGIFQLTRNNLVYFFIKTKNRLDSLKTDTYQNSWPIEKKEAHGYYQNLYYLISNTMLRLEELQVQLLQTLVEIEQVAKPGNRLFSLTNKVVEKWYGVRTELIETYLEVKLAQQKYEAYMELPEASSCRGFF